MSHESAYYSSSHSHAGGHGYTHHNRDHDRPRDYHRQQHGVRGNQEQSHSARVKRKPPPAFPYSTKYPVPDPNDPFAPLEVLRGRAYTNPATPPDEPFTTYPVIHVDRGDTGKPKHLLTADANVHPSDHGLSPGLASSSHHRTQTTGSAKSSTGAALEKSVARPWQLLSSGYLSDAMKPMRPPRSRVRPGRDSVAYFSDVEVTPDIRQGQEHQHDAQHQYQHPQHPPQQRQQQNTSTIAPPSKVDDPQATVRSRIPKPDSAAAQLRESQYHYRRRSQSVLVLSSPNVAPPLTSNSDVTTVKAASRPGTSDQSAQSQPQMPASHSRGRNSPPKAELSRQYTYDERQSHGYMCEYTVDSEQRLVRGHESLAPTNKSSRTGSENASPEQSHHPTPPMTPDDSVSTMSTSPPGDISLAGRRSGSVSPPLIQHDVPVIVQQVQVKPDLDLIVQQKPALTSPPREERGKRLQAPPTPQVADTPASIQTSDFPLLLPPRAASSLNHASATRVQTQVHPPPSAPASMTSHEPSQDQTYASTHAHAPTITTAAAPHVESEPESSMFSAEGRRKTHVHLHSLKRRLAKPSTTARGRRSSNPSPLLKLIKKSSFASDSSVSVGHGLEGRTTNASSANPSVQTAAESSTNSKLMVPNVPKPKKSLSTVNLKLKPLPNVSMGPPATPADTTHAGAPFGLGIMNIPDAREDDRARSDERSLHNVPAPQPTPQPPSSVAAVLARVAPPRMVQQPEYESETEDMGSYTALLALRELLTSPPSMYPLPLDPRGSNFFASPLHESTPAPSQRSVQPSPPPLARSTPPPRLPTPPTPPRPVSPRPVVKASQPAVQKQTALQRSTALRKRSESPIQKVSTSNAHKVEPVNVTKPLLLPRKNERNDVSEPMPRSESPVQKGLPRRRSESPIQRPSAPKSVEQPVHRPVHGQRRSDSPMQRESLSQKKESPRQRTSPVDTRSESPVHHRVQAIAAAPPRAPSPVKQRSSPVQRRSESPVQHRVQRRSESPVQQRQVPVQRHIPSHRSSTSPVEHQMPAQTSKRPHSPMQPLPRVIRRSDSPPQNTMYLSNTPPRSESPEPMYALSPDSPRSESPEPTYSEMMSPSSQAFTPVTPYENVISPRAMSPIPDGPAMASSVGGSSQSRTRSPTPTSQKARNTAESRPLPKRDNPRTEEHQAEASEGYLPIAQLRSEPSSASKQTSSSQGTSRKHSTQIANVQNRPSSRTGTRPRSPTPPIPPVRARSPAPRDIISPRERQMQALPREPDPESESEPESPEPYSPPVRRQRTAPPTPALALNTSPAVTTRSHGNLPSQSDYHSRNTRSGRHRRNTPPSPMAFSEDALVTREQLTRAASLVVITQGGIRVPFGDLLKDRKTIVIFIRHFWCAMCQDYMYSIRKNVDAGALKRAGVELVIIGNGSPAMIKSYRNIFRTPFSLYTDPTMRLYAALGMTLRSNDPGLESEKGSYARHGLVGGIAMVVRNALKVGMPIWEKGGEVTQLGGEFIFGPGMTCSYSHRMKNTRSHAPITEVLAAADIHTYYSHSGSGTSRSMLAIHDEEQWMDDRQRSLDRIRAKKEMRRRGAQHHHHYGEQCDSESESESQDMPSMQDIRRNEPRPQKGRYIPSQETHETLAQSEDHHRSHKHRRKPNGHGKFHVSNPDPDYQYSSRYDSMEKSEKRDVWRADLAKMPTKYSQRDAEEDEYLATHEALSYSYGQA